MGPIASKDIPNNASISHRFAIWQKTKYRCIDDYSASQVNATCNIYGSLVLHTVDVSAALLDEWMQSARDLKNECILARSFDLKSAYRQLFIKASERHHGYLAVLP